MASPLRLPRLARGLALSLALATAWITTGAPAFAQKPMTTAQRQEAKRLFNQGWLAYNQHEYEEAIVKWEASHAISGEPLIFEAISNAYAQLGDLERARDYLGRYRVAAPKDEFDALDARLQSLDERIAAVKRADAETQRAADAEKAREDEAARARALAEAHEAVDRYDARELRSTAGWTLVGVGAGAVGVGVLVDVAAAATRPDESAVCADAGAGLLCRSSSRDDIETSNALAIGGDVTWILGAAATVAGVVLVVTGDHGDEDDAPTVGLALRPAASAPALFAVGRF